MLSSSMDKYEGGSHDEEGTELESQEKQEQEQEQEEEKEK